MKMEDIYCKRSRNCDDIIVINYCIQYTKYYIYLEKLKDNNNKSCLNVDFLGYLCYLKETVKIENRFYLKQNQIVKFDKFKVIF